MKKHAQSSGIGCRSCLLSTFLSLVLLNSLHATDHKVAVIVGINDYQPQPRAELPDLQYAVRDADVLGAALHSTGFSEIVLTGTSGESSTDSPKLIATAAQISREIDRTLNDPKLDDGDIVIISLHGHGVQFAAGPNDEKPQFYFCPADANLRGIQTAADVTDSHCLIPLGEVYAKMERCRASTKILVVDACRNDPTRPAIFRGGLASATRPKLPPPRGGLIALFSCKQNERAVEDSGLKQGVFSHFLVQGLLGKADQPFLGKAPDGVITLQELAAYVSHQTQEFVKASYGGMQQTPELQGQFDADLPLVGVRSFEGLSPDELIALHGGRLGEGFDMEFIKVEGGEFEYAKGLRLVRVPTMFVGRFEVTVGQYRRFVEATEYETVAELAGAGDFNALKARGYRLGKGEVRNGVYEFTLADLFGAGLENGSQSLIRNPDFSWKNPGWQQTDNHPVINLTAQDMFAFQDWLQRSAYRDIRIAKEQELVWACYRGSNPTETDARERQEHQDWLAARPPRAIDRSPVAALSKPIMVLPQEYGDPDGNKFGYGTLPVTWQDPGPKQFGGLFSNAIECSENPLVDRNLCMHSAGMCLPTLHSPLVAGFRMVIPVQHEGEHKNRPEVSSSSDANSPAPKAGPNAIDRQQLEQSSLTSFAFASYMRTSNAQNRRLGGVIHNDYPTAILTPDGAGACLVWKSSDGQFIYVSRDNETLRFRSSEVRMLQPIQ